MPAPAPTRNPIHDINAAITAIRAFSDLYANHSSLDEDLALDAYQAQRPAYWSKSSYSNQLAAIFLEVANRSGMDAALTRCARDHDRNYMRHSSYLIGTLIPLNAKAVSEIERVWSQIGDARIEVAIARSARPEPMFADELVAAE